MRNRKEIIALVIFFLLIFNVVALAAAPTPARTIDKSQQLQVKPELLRQWIKVTAPAANFGTADDHTIKISWKYSGVGLVGSSVKIDVYKSSMLLETIIPSCPIGLNNAGSYDWRVGRGWALTTGHGGGGDFQIKITSLKNGNVTAMSPNFWITQMVY